MALSEWYGKHKQLCAGLLAGLIIIILIVLLRPYVGKAKPTQAPNAAALDKMIDTINAA